MSRPTAEEVDAVLKLAEQEAGAGTMRQMVLDVLAAEVRALREDLTRAETLLSVAEKGLDEAAMTQLRLSRELEDVGRAARQTEDYRALALMRAEQLARVEALPGKWRSEIDSIDLAIENAAQDLEEALRGQER